MDSMWRADLKIVGLHDKEHVQPLEAESGFQLTAGKKIRSSVLNKELNSAHNLNDLGSGFCHGFFSRASG